MDFIYFDFVAFNLASSLRRLNVREKKKKSKSFLEQNYLSLKRKIVSNREINAKHSVC